MIIGTIIVTVRHETSKLNTPNWPGSHQTAEELIGNLDLKAGPTIDFTPLTGVGGF